MNKTGVIYGINGPVIYLKGNTGFEMSEMVYVGKERLVGEVIALDSGHHHCTGLRGDNRPETRRNRRSQPETLFPLLLAPGILNNIFDGIERPLSEIAAKSAAHISAAVCP